MKTYVIIKDNKYVVESGDTIPASSIYSTDNSDIDEAIIECLSYYDAYMYSITPNLGIHVVHDEPSRMPHKERIERGVYITIKFKNKLIVERSSESVDKKGTLGWYRRFHSYMGMLSDVEKNDVVKSYTDCGYGE